MIALYNWRRKQDFSLWKKKEEAGLVSQEKSQLGLVGEKGKLLPEE